MTATEQYIVGSIITIVTSIIVGSILASLKRNRDKLEDHSDRIARLESNQNSIVESLSELKDGIKDQLAEIKEGIKDQRNICQQVLTTTGDTHKRRIDIPIRDE